MAFSKLSTLLLVFVIAQTAYSKNLGALDAVQDDHSTSHGSAITMNFQHGMRDLVVNGNGVKSFLKHIPAFFATLTSGTIGPNYAHDAIKFNDVSINVESGYNPGTGKFKAPVDGIYQISFSYLQHNGYTSHVQLIKDGVMYTEVHANHKSHDQLSKTVLIQMKKGETVWVRLVKSSVQAVYGGGRYTTFAGYLISH